MYRLLSSFIMFISLGMLLSCSDDDYTYPSVLTEMSVARTDKDSIISTLILDDGTVLTPSNRIRTPKNDSTFRIMCTYLPEGENNAKIYKATLLTSMLAADSSAYDYRILRDPVKVVSVWMGGGYVNMRLGVMTKGDKQEFSFLHETTEFIGGSQKRITLSLYHDQKDDMEAYTQEKYLSCPLEGLDVTEGDSIIFKIMTYEGDKAFRFRK